MYMLGIDIGATFIKSAILDLERRELLHPHQSLFPLFLLNSNPHIKEVQPQRIVEEVKYHIDFQSSFHPEGVLMCGQMHGMVLVDNHNKPVSNFISWQDQRCNEEHHTYTTGFGPSYFQLLRNRLAYDDYPHLGNEVLSGSPLSNLFWLKEKNQLLEGATSYSLMDFVASQICGGSHICATDVTQAAAHGLYSHKTKNWYFELIKNLGLDKLILPVIVSSNSMVGRVIGSNGHKMNCYVPCGDQQTALVGALLEEGELSINMGTGSQVSTISKDYVTGHYQTRPFFDEKYLKTVTHLPAGRALNVLFSPLSEFADGESISDNQMWDYINRQVEHTPITDLSVDLSFFPCAMGKVGSIKNITEDNFSIGDIFRAAFRNMAENYSYKAVGLGGNFINLVFSGGLAQKLPSLRGEVMRRFPKLAYRLSPWGDETLMGLLLLGQVYRGMYKTVDEAIKQAKEKFHANC